MRLVIVGKGKMGRAIAALAEERGHEVAALIGREENDRGGALMPERLSGVDAALEFTSPPSAAENVRRLIDAGVPTVCGTTGWDAAQEDIAHLVKARRGALLYAANFSVGVQLFLRAARELGRQLAGHDDFEASISEEHHAAKRDAPSGTALVLQKRLREVDPARDFPITSVREGATPGIHTIGYDGRFERIALTHVARSREGFAAGALAAAEWLPGRVGVFGIEDMLFGGLGMSSLQGCGTALVTPFTDSGAVDLPALRALTDWQIKEGIDFLVPCGSTGEAQTLDDGERERVVAAVVEVSAGRVPVMAGATSNDTARAVAETRRMCRLGVDYILSATPYYNKPGQEGLHRHFAAVADASEKPVFLYNVPGRTAVNLKPATALRLAEHPNVIGIKEASGDLKQVMEIIAGRPPGFSVLSGDDWLTLPIVAAGGDGLISVTSNEVPGPMTAFVHVVLSGDFESARRWHYRLLPLMDANFLETNPGPVKAALAHLGRIQNVLRLPLIPASQTTCHALRNALEGLQ